MRRVMVLISMKKTVLLTFALLISTLILMPLPADLPTYVIGSQENGVDSILSVLSGLESVDAIHIVSHGNDNHLAFDGNFVANVTLFTIQTTDVSKGLGRTD